MADDQPTCYDGEKNYTIYNQPKDYTIYNQRLIQSLVLGSAISQKNRDNISMANLKTSHWQRLQLEAFEKCQLAHFLEVM